MIDLISNKTRLLFGALLLSCSFLVSMQFSGSTFLFCLNPDSPVLDIDKEGASFIVRNNQTLDKTLHDIGVVDIQSWIPGATEIDKHGDVFLNRIYRVYIKQGYDVRNVMGLLDSSYPLLYVEHENIHRLHYTPNDPNYSQQCSMSSVKADKAWDFWSIPEGIVPDGQEVLLASVDTGVDYTHPDLKGSLWINQGELPGWTIEAGIDLNGDQYVSSLEIEEFMIVNSMDFNLDGVVDLRDLVCENSGFFDGLDNDGNSYTDDILGWDSSGYSAVSSEDPDPYPREGANSTGTWAHGTHVAGILAATTDNSAGMASASYNAKIVSVKASRDSQSTDPGVNDGYAGITYAAKAGYYSGTFTIINNSWGGGSYTFSEHSVIQNAHNTYGAVILSSAGNGDSVLGEYAKEYPASYDDVLSVCAIGCSGIWGGWATYHPSVDLAAPGEGILSAIIGQGYEAWDGSSMACPNAASVIGLLKAYYPQWNNDQLIERVLSTSDRFIYELNPDYEVTCMTDENTEVFCNQNGSPVTNPDDGDGNCDCLGQGMIDAYKAIGVDFSPSISFESYSYEIIDGDGDDVLNPGDSFNLFITLKNEDGWAEASNLEVSLGCANSSVSLLDNHFNFSALGSGDVYTNQIPILVNLGDSIDLNDIDLSITVSALGSDDYNYSEILLFSIPVSLMQSGYPYDTNSQIDSSPLVVDLNDDGILEVVFGDRSGLVHVLQADGAPIDSEIFPYSTNDAIWASPASADIDLDGQLDFVITSIDKNLYAFDLNGLKFSYNADQSLIATPSIGNIDQDDELEIVFGAYESSGDIFAVNHDGTDVVGFPIEINEKIFKGVALHDLNNNGLDDIVFATDGDDYIGVCYDNGNLDTLLIADRKFKSAPSIVRSSGGYIVIAGSEDDNMYGVSLNGEVLFEFDADRNANSSASFVSLDGEIYAFFGSDDDFIYAVNMSGEVLPGWPQEVGGNVDHSVSFSDLNGDGEPEAIIGVSNKLYAFHMNGALYDRFPISYEFSFASSPIIRDLDSDGDLEIVLGSTGSLVSIDIMEPGSLLNNLGLPYWNQGRSDNRRTGFFFAPMVGDVNSDGFLDLLDIIVIVNSIVNNLNLEGYQVWAGDLNQDQVVDVLDVTLIVNSIVGR